MMFSDLLEKIRFGTDLEADRYFVLSSLTNDFEPDLLRYLVSAIDEYFDKVKEEKVVNAERNGVTEKEVNDLCDSIRERYSRTGFYLEMLFDKEENSSQYLKTVEKELGRIILFRKDILSEIDHHQSESSGESSKTENFKEDIFKSCEVQELFHCLMTETMFQPKSEVQASFLFREMTQDSEKLIIRGVTHDEFIDWINGEYGLEIKIRTESEMGRRTTIQRRKEYKTKKVELNV
ncbi:MAG: hypothetical protein HON12_00455 [Flavobacteriales bacterium]|nr:hypothetical protein [Flavobacteriales bacterium]